jgi:hypothetical protein
MNIQSRLGKDGETPEAKAAVKEFCEWFYKGFSFWMNIATLQDVEGTGPVPTYNPGANIYAGPVVNGTANGGFITPSPSWFEP